MPKRGSAAFYGDSGTVFNGPAREQIQIDRLDHGNSHTFQDRRDPDELNGSYGDPQSESNDADFSQRYAQGPGDEYMEQAERMVGKNSWAKNPAMRAKMVEYFANQLRASAPAPATQDEEREKPFSSNEFWNDREEVQKAAKQVRPRKL